MDQSLLTRWVKEWGNTGHPASAAQTGPDDREVSWSMPARGGHDAESGETVVEPARAAPVVDYPELVLTSVPAPVIEKINQLQEQVDLLKEERDLLRKWKDYFLKAEK